jgi:hypothetical protein
MIDKELLDQFKTRRLAFEQAEAALAESEKAYREAEEILWDQMLELGLPNIRIEGLGTCSKVLKGPYCSIDHEDDPLALVKFRTWCEDNGYSEIFKWQPAMSALNPIVKTMREKGEPLPPGIKLTEHRRIQVLKR